MSAALKTGELNDEAQAFIRGVPPAAPEREQRIEAGVQPESSRPEVEPSEQQMASARSTPKGTVRQLPVMVSLSTRIPAELHEKLMRASFERKLARQETSTHQGILTEAIAAWLKKNGYA